MPNGQCVAIINAPRRQWSSQRGYVHLFTPRTANGHLERKIEDDVVGITTSYEYARAAT